MPDRFWLPVLISCLAGASVRAEALPSTPDAPTRDTLRDPLDFELLEPAAATALSPEQLRDVERKQELGRTRRVMLTVHQGVGFATLAGLIATTVVGQLNYSDRYGGGGGTGRFALWHRGLYISTSVLFAGSGLLALFAPHPFARRLAFDVTMIHRIAMAIATAGMVTQIVLGILVSTGAGTLDQARLAMVHQAVGYTTLAAMSVGTVVLLF